MKTDSLFYRLFQEQPELVFELAELAGAGRGGLHPACRRGETDQLPARWAVTATPGLTRICQGSLSRRSFNWITTSTVVGLTQIFLFLYRQQWQGPWRAVVIFPNRKVDPQPPLAYQPLLDSPWVKRVYLEDLKDRTDLTPG